MQRQYWIPHGAFELVPQFVPTNGSSVFRKQVSHLHLIGQNSEKPAWTPQWDFKGDTECGPWETCVNGKADGMTKPN